MARKKFKLYREHTQKFEAVLYAESREEVEDMVANGDADWELVWENDELQIEEDESRFTVWVGGTEVNDYLLTEAEADKFVETYRSAGYTGVVKEKIK